MAAAAAAAREEWGNNNKSIIHCRQFRSAQLDMLVVMLVALSAPSRLLFTLRGAHCTVITLETVIPHKEQGLPRSLIAW